MKKYKSAEKYEEYPKKIIKEEFLPEQSSINVEKTIAFLH